MEEEDRVNNTKSFKDNYKYNAKKVLEIIENNQNKEEAKGINNSETEVEKSQLII